MATNFSTRGKVQYHDQSNNAPPSIHRLRMSRVPAPVGKRRVKRLALASYQRECQRSLRATPSTSALRDTRVAPKNRARARAERYWQPATTSVFPPHKFNT